MANQLMGSEQAQVTLSLNLRQVGASDRFPKKEPPKNQAVYIGEPILIVGFSDFNATTVGFTASAGICYRITPALGVGLRADGFFASFQMKNKDSWTDDISRRINRIGVSAEVSVNF